MDDAPTKPDREVQGGGDFAAGIGPTHYGSAPLPLQVGEDVAIDMGNVAGNHTFTVTPRGGPTFTYVAQGFSYRVFPGRGIATIAIDSADSSVAWEKRTRGGFYGATSGGNVNIKNAPTVNTASLLASGGVAGVNGWAWLTASTTDANGVSITDGTNNQPIAPVGTIIKTVTASTWENYEFAIVSGKTYTLAGTGILVLGGSFVVRS